MYFRGTLIGEWEITMNNIIFEVTNAHFSYLSKFPALCGVDIVIEQGSKIAIIGANGSGKSTLLHLLDGLMFVDTGTVSFCGEELRESRFTDEGFSREFRRRVGLVFQNPDVQLFCPTVKEDILFGPLQLGMGKKQMQKRFDELVVLLEIAHLLERSPHNLSIGEKRKVAIASSLIIDPDILLLDEPTAGLDPMTTRVIMDLLVQSHASGKTIVTSTHDLHIVEEIADTVYVFSKEQKIIQSGPADTILKDTLLLQAHNLVHIHAHRHKDTMHKHPHVHLDHHV